MSYLCTEFRKASKVKGPLRSKSKAVKHYLLTRERLGLGTQEALHQAEHKLFAKMKENVKKNATKVAKADDNVKQLVESIKGQRQLEEKS